MKPKKFEAMMRKFETDHDFCVPEDNWMVARLDGRGFTKLTEMYHFKKPFDLQYNIFMKDTALFLLKKSGFNIIYAYVQSDEISLLFHLNETLYNRKVRKFNSVLAGLASARFTDIITSYKPGMVKPEDAYGTFDCRISVLPCNEDVVDYFRWRQADCERNFLQSLTYWTLRLRDGLSKRAATSTMKGASIDDKKAMLYNGGVNSIEWDAEPTWAKRGFDIRWYKYFKQQQSLIQAIQAAAHDDEEVKPILRRAPKINVDLPTKMEYSIYMEKLLIESVD